MWQQRAVGPPVPLQEQYLAKYVEVGFTSEMEGQLDKVAERQLQWQQVGCRVGGGGLAAPKQPQAQQVRGLGPAPHAHSELLHLDSSPQGHPSGPLLLAQLLCSRLD
jgi:hypothetical protein